MCHIQVSHYFNGKIIGTVYMCFVGNNIKTDKNNNKIDFDIKRRSVKFFAIMELFPKCYRVSI